RHRTGEAVGELVVAELEHGRGHGRNVAACWARSRTGPGTTPRRTVPSAQTATATEVSPSERTTAVRSPSGSVKNVSTMGRVKQNAAAALAGTAGPTSTVA